MKHKQTPAPRSWREGRRLRAWALHQAGWKQQDIATALGCSQGSVSGWIKRAGSGSDPADALRDRPPPGAPRRLSEEQLASLPGLLSAGATSYGWIGDLWTTARVAALIKEQFGVSYHPAHMSRLLRRIGWSVQKPLTKASQRDEAAARKWAAERWPEIKKKRRKRTAASSG